MQAVRDGNRASVGFIKACVWSDFDAAGD